MSEFSDGFITGFANTLASGIDERNKIARDYFQKQYEIATTVGLQNQRKVESQIEGSVKVAKQLQQMGVPRNIIMAVASQDPQGLGDFYDMVADAQASGVTLDEGFFNDFVQVSSDFKAPDESFEQFFGKAFRPVARAAKENPDQFNQDRKGGIFAAMFGTDPYGRARRQLDETIVLDGLSASDLLQYGEHYQPPGVQGGPTVTFDYNKSRPPKDSRESALSVAETKSINDQIKERATALQTNTNLTEEERYRTAAEEVLKEYSHIPEASKYITETYLGDGGAPKTPEADLPKQDGLTELGITEPGGAPPAATPPPEEAPVPQEQPAAVEPGLGQIVANELIPGNPDSYGVGQALRTINPMMGPVVDAIGGLIGDSYKTSADPIDPQTEPELTRLEIEGVIYEFKENDENGMAVYVNPVTGEEFEEEPAVVRQYVASR